MAGEGGDRASWEPARCYGVTGCLGVGQPSPDQDGRTDARDHADQDVQPVDAPEDVSHVRFPFLFRSLTGN